MPTGTPSPAALAAQATQTLQRRRREELDVGPIRAGFGEILSKVVGPSLYSAQSYTGGALTRELVPSFLSDEGENSLGFIQGLPRIGIGTVFDILSRPAKFAALKVKAGPELAQAALGAVGIELPESIRAETGPQATFSEALATHFIDPIRALTPFEAPEERDVSFSKVLAEAGVPAGPVLNLGPLGETTPRGMGGLALDIALDPLTYVGAGVLTKAGKFAKTASSLSQAERNALKALAANDDALRTAKQAGKVTAQQEELIDAVRATPAIADGLRPTWAEQARSGQRAMVTFAGESILQGERGFEILGRFSEAAARTKVGRSLRSLFTRRVWMADKARESQFESMRAAEIGRQQSVAHELGEEVSKFVDTMRKNGVTEGEERVITEVAEEMRRRGPEVNSIMEARGVKDPARQSVIRQYAQEARRIDDLRLQMNRELGVNIPDLGSDLQKMREKISRDFQDYLAETESTIRKKTGRRIADLETDYRQLVRQSEKVIDQGVGVEDFNLANVAPKDLQRLEHNLLEMYRQKSEALQDLFKIREELLGLAPDVNEGVRRTLAADTVQFVDAEITALETRMSTLSKDIQPIARKRLKVAKAMRAAHDVADQIKQSMVGKNADDLWKVIESMRAGLPKGAKLTVEDVVQAIPIVGRKAADRQVIGKLLRQGQKAAEQLKQRDIQFQNRVTAQARRGQGPNPSPDFEIPEELTRLRDDYYRAADRLESAGEAAFGAAKQLRRQRTQAYKQLDKGFKELNPGATDADVGAFIEGKYRLPGETPRQSTFQRVAASVDTVPQRNAEMVSGMHSLYENLERLQSLRDEAFRRFSKTTAKFDEMRQRWAKLGLRVDKARDRRLIRLQNQLAKKNLSIANQREALERMVESIPRRDRAQEFRLKLTEIDQAIRDVPGHIPHILTAEAKDILDRSPSMQRRLFTSYTDRAVRRKWREKRRGGVEVPMTADEVNQVIKETGSLQTGPKFLDLVLGRGDKGAKQVSELFETRISEILMSTAQKEARVLARAEFMMKAKNTWGRLTENAPAGWTAAKDKYFKGYAFPDEIAKALDTVEKLSRASVETSRFWKGWDRFQSWVKANLLFVSPAYAGRNAVGNFYLMWLAGWNPLEKEAMGSVNDAARSMLAYAKNSPRKIKVLDETLETVHGKKTKREVMDEFLNQGLNNAGFFAAEADLTATQIKNLRLGASLEAFASNFREAPVQFFANPFSRKHVWQTSIQLASSFSDNHARLTLFLDRLKKGKTFAEAADDVRTFLFDYADITPFEVGVMRRVFPFYTWMRKNIPLQLRSIVQQPGKPAAVLKLQRTLTEETELDSAQLRAFPKWIADAGGIPVRQRGNKVSFFLFGNTLPFGDINRASDPFKLAWDSLDPTAKTVIELQANRNLFTGQEIQSYKGEKRKVMVGGAIPMTVDSRVAHLLTRSRLLAELDKLGRSSRKGDRTAAEIALWNLGLKEFDVDLKANEIRMKREKVEAFLRGKGVPKTEKFFLPKQFRGRVDGDTVRALNDLKRLRLQQQIHFRRQASPGFTQRWDRD